MTETAQKNPRRGGWQQSKPINRVRPQTVSKAEQIAAEAADIDAKHKALKADYEHRERLRQRRARERKKREERAKEALREARKK